MPKRNAFVIAVVVVGCLLAWMARDRAGHGRRFAEVLAAIDAHALHRVEPRRLFTAAMNGVFGQLDDHSGFIDGADQRQFEALLDQEFGGVGLELSLAADGRRIAVLSPIVDSPAWRAGIVSGAFLDEIDGVSTAGMSLDDAVSRLRGEPGSRVVVRIATPEAGPATRDPTAAEPMSSRVVPLVRERVAVESVLGDRRREDGSWEWMVEGEDRVALLRITAFGERTAEEVRAAIEAIEKEGEPRGVVIDLRGNGGGLLTAAVAVCDLLLDDGVIVSTRGGLNGDGERVATMGHLLDGVPVVVLVDALTASAAEIVAACLQDHGRATVVGSRTYGKGTVQTLLTLSDGSGMVKLTTAEYLRPSRATIDRGRDAGDADVWGVVPAAAFQIAPTGKQLERLRLWRRSRDAVPSPGVSGSPAGGLPRDADVALRRGLDALGR